MCIRQLLDWVKARNNLLMKRTTEEWMATYK